MSTKKNRKRRVFGRIRREIDGKKVVFEQTAAGLEIRVIHGLKFPAVSHADLYFQAIGQKKLL